MQSKSYPKLTGSEKTLQILKAIGDKPTPTTPAEIASELDMTYATIMAHLTTLEREKMVENVGAGYIVGMEAAKLYIRRKGITEKKQRDLDKEKDELGI